MASGSLFFRFRDFRDQVLITNDFGKFQFLDKLVFERLHQQGKASEELFERLEKDLFYLKDSDADVQKAAELFNTRYQYLRHGPSVVTLKVSALSGAKLDPAEKDSHPAILAEETAKKAVDLVFETTSPHLTFVLAGEDPLDHPERVDFILDAVKAKEAESGKTTTVILQTSADRLTPAILDDFAVKEIVISPKLPGDAIVQPDKHPGAISAVKHLYTECLDDAKGPLRVGGGDALTKTPEALASFMKEHGVREVDLLLLDTHNFVHGDWHRSAPAEDTSMDFYLRFLDRLLEENTDAFTAVESTAAAMLGKMFGDGNPYDPDLRSPHGDGLGQLCISHDGLIFASPTGQILYDVFDEDSFLLGKVGAKGFDKVMEDDTIRSIAVASCLEGQPECEQCAFYPYCGVSPTYNYLEQGDIFGQTRTNRRCRRTTEVFTALFTKILENEAGVVAKLQRWADPQGQ